MNEPHPAQAEGVSETPGQTNGQEDVFLPKTPEQFTQDADGNLIRDGIWDYEWDGENRLKAMNLRPPVAALRLGLGDSWLRLEFAYDYLGRRITKRYLKSPDNPNNVKDAHGAEIHWKDGDYHERIV